VIVAANHQAGVDPLLLQSCTSRVISFIVAREHYRVPFFGWVMRQADCIPVNRENPGKEFLESALKLLQGGGCLGMFPQGTFSPPGQPPLPPRPGLAALALRTGTSVIPAHISGVNYSPRAFGALLLRHDARVRFGRSIDMKDYAGRERDPQAADELTERIMREIHALGG
jgi:1-acyl-sn-glycerol-3-phosphate acyltransferase